MFGRKKNKKQDEDVTLNATPTDDGVVVHTMASDLSSIGNDGAELSQDQHRGSVEAPATGTSDSPFSQTQTQAQSQSQPQTQPQPQSDPFATQGAQENNYGENAATATDANPFAQQEVTPQGFATTPQQGTGASPFSANVVSDQGDTESMAGTQSFGGGAIDQEISHVQNDNILIQDDGEASKKSRAVPMILFILLGIIIITAIAAGYYYFSSRNAAQELATDTPVTINDAMEDGIDTVGDAMVDTADTVGDAMNDGLDIAAVTAGDIVEDVGAAIVDEPILSEYSEVLPNYIFINTEDDAATELGAKLQEISANMQTQQSASAIAFTITDSSNAQIALQRYNDLTDLALPTEVLSAVDELFTLYAYNDKGQIRFGLVAAVTDPQTAVNALRASEATLPTAMTYLFNGAVPDVVAPVFGDGTYGENAIRYANLTVAQDLSVDYAILGNQMIIGTSKDTIRAIIDKEAIISQ